MPSELVSGPLRRSPRARVATKVLLCLSHFPTKTLSATLRKQVPVFCLYSLPRLTEGLSLFSPSTVSLDLSIKINVDPVFLDACVRVHQQPGILTSLSPTDTLVSPTTTLFSPTALISKAGVVTEMTRLTDKYKNAYTDFYGSGTPCIHKTGPAWPKREGIEEQKLIRAARPIYYHRIEPTWGFISWAIVAVLDKLQVDWNAVNPLAYANAGEAALICDFVITIGVRPGSLAYDAAVRAANAVDEILRTAGFPEIQVALIESVYRRRGTGPKLMNFDPLLDSIAGLRKAFTHILGLSIAPLKSPHFEGTGGLFYRLSSDERDKRVVLSTCAHVARPPPLFENKTYTRKNESQAREDIVLLGTGAFEAAVQALMKFIGDQAMSISGWEKQRKRLGEPVDDEPANVTKRRKEFTDLIDAAKNKIEEADKLHTEVTKYRTTAAQRVFGYVLHCEKIEVGVGEHKFTNDWSFISMDENMVDWDKFLGNKLYIGSCFAFFTFD